MKEIGVSTFVSLNSGIEIKEITEQINDLHNVGYDNVVLHARAGLKTEYLSKEWFNVYKACLKEARKNNFTITVYDENGWPSGYCEGRISRLGEEYSAKTLLFTTDINDIERGHIISAYKKDGEGYKLTEIDKGELFAYYKLNTQYIDTLSSKATDKFIEYVYERYYSEFKEYFGKEIVAFFTDEPVAYSTGEGNYAWNFDLPKVFSSVNGYDLLENLWKLNFKENKKAIYDYRKVIAKLFIENYTEKIGKWCADKGITLTGHFSLEESISYSNYASGGCMSNYRYMTPGIDALGNRLIPITAKKQVDSIKNQYSKSESVVECFGGAGYGASYDDLLYIYSDLAVNGITSPCTHLSAYSIEGRRKRDFPQFFSYQSNGYKELNCFISRIKDISSFVRKGKYDSKVLVLSSLSSCFAEWRETDETRKISHEFRNLLENLQELGVQYDIADEFCLETDGKIQGDKIILQDKEYSLIIVPYINSMFSSTYKLLKEYKENGGKIILTENRPNKIDYKDSKEITELFADEFLAYNRLNNLEVMFNEKYPELCTVKFVEANTNILCKGLEFRVSFKDNKKYILVLNKDKTYEKSTQIVVQGKGELYVEEDGKAVLINSNYDGENTYSDIIFKGGASKKIVYISGKRKDEYKALKTGRSELELKGISIKDKNCLVIDRASYKINDGEISSKNLPIILTEEINKKVVKIGKSANVKVYYEFTAKSEISKVEVYAETKKTKHVKFDGKEIVSNGEYFIDKSIVGYNIFKVEKGVHVIELCFNVEPVIKEKDDSGLDTLNNVFAYDLELENIYLLGEFRVEGKINEGRIFNELENDVKISSEEKGVGQDFTLNGLPFYRGRIQYEFVYRKVGNKISEKLYVEGSESLALKVFVNDKPVGCLYKGYGLEINKQTKIGENKIVIELITKDRNVLGAFHHKWGETSITSPLSYIQQFCIGEYVDKKAVIKENLHTDNYMIRKIYLGKVYIESEEY